MELTDLNAKQLAAGYRAKEFSVADVVGAHLTQIEKENPKLNAYLEVFDDAQAEAKLADERLVSEGASAHALLGVPVAVKDNILIKGKKASAASRMLENHVAAYDATAISKLKTAGAIFLGRTNMDEFALGGSTENSAYGVTKNPLDTSRVAGGTSGGSAAAVAAHMAPIALGSDTGGSVRNPASFCGIVGLKPTYGAVSRSGLIAAVSSFDQIGPLARTVADAEILLNAIKGPDILDGTTLPEYESSKDPVKTVGVPMHLFEKSLEADVLKTFTDALSDLEKKGMKVNYDITLPSSDAALAQYYILNFAEVSTNLERFDGMRYGLSHDGGNLFEEYSQARAKGFGPETKRRIILGTYVLSHGYYDAYYRKAEAARSVLDGEFSKAFGAVDVVAMPTMPMPAFKIGEKSDPLSLYLADIFTVLANITGLPAISVPCGTVSRDGVDLPIGMQFMGSKRSEGRLCAVARDMMGESK